MAVKRVKVEIEYDHGTVVCEHHDLEALLNNENCEGMYHVRLTPGGVTLHIPTSTRSWTGTEKEDAS